MKPVDIFRGSRTCAVARSATVFLSHAQRVYRYQGMRGFVLRMKSCHVLTMQAVGGMRLEATQDLGPAVSRSGSGLPRIIPREHRARIMGGDRVLLRIWLS